jgi:hypothetical protein
MEIVIHIFENPDEGFWAIPMPKGSTREEALCQVAGYITGEPVDQSYPEHFDRWGYLGTISTTEMDSFGRYGWS